MSANDVANGIFELGGAFSLAWFNLRSIIRDKKLAGVSWVPVGFFTLWGLWNLHYYDALHQPVSWWGGLATVIVNSIWLGLVAYYDCRGNRTSAG